MSSRQNGRKPVQPGGATTEYLEEVVDTGIDDELATPLHNLLAKDFPLANIRRADREYFRLLSENVALYVEEMFPPEDSLLQGDLGAALLEDPDYQTAALSQRKRNNIQTLLMTAFARTSRGESGWQQEKLGENIQTRRVEDNRVPEENSGLIGGLFE